jgi:hypothetical protein
MSTVQQIHNHFNGVIFGGNWTDSCLKGQLDGIKLEDAQRKIFNIHSIAELTYHIHYFIRVAGRVLDGGPLIGNDQFSFDLPQLENEEDWQEYLNSLWADAEAFAKGILKCDEDRLFEDFVDPKYGNYYSNIHGIIEHSHYHLGQIALIKKILDNRAEKD